MKAAATPLRACTQAPGVGRTPHLLQRRCSQSLAPTSSATRPLAYTAIFMPR